MYITNLQISDLTNHLNFITDKFSWSLFIGVSILICVLSIITVTITGLLESWYKKRPSFFSKITKDFVNIFIYTCLTIVLFYYTYLVCYWILYKGISFLLVTIFSYKITNFWEQRFIIMIFGVVSLVIGIFIKNEFTEDKEIKKLIKILKILKLDINRFHEKGEDFIVCTITKKDFDNNMNLLSPDEAWNILLSFSYLELAAKLNLERSQSNNFQNKQLSLIKNHIDDTQINNIIEKLTNIQNGKLLKLLNLSRGKTEIGVN